MTAPRLSPENYARVTAIVTHTTLKTTIERAFPDLSQLHLDEMIADIIDRMARMRGFAIQRNRIVATDEESDP